MSFFNKFIEKCTVKTLIACVPALHTRLTWMSFSYGLRCEHERALVQYVTHFVFYREYLLDIQEEKFPQFPPTSSLKAAFYSCWLFLRDK